MDSQDSDMPKHLYRDPNKVIYYMDYEANPVPDNSRYIPELVLGMLQPLEINDIMDDPKTDEWLASVDIENIVQQAKASTKDVEKKME